jgi:hypothetical protein
MNLDNVFATYFVGLLWFLTPLKIIHLVFHPSIKVLPNLQYGKCRNHNILCLHHYVQELDMILSIFLNTNSSIKFSYFLFSSTDENFELKNTFIHIIYHHENTRGKIVFSPEKAGELPNRNVGSKCINQGPEVTETEPKSRT